MGIRLSKKQYNHSIRLMHSQLIDFHGFEISEYIKNNFLKLCIYDFQNRWTSRSEFKVFISKNRINY